MVKFKEALRYIATLFAMGFIFGILYDCTLQRTTTTDIRIGIGWGVMCIIIITLNDYIWDTNNRKNKIVKEERRKMIEELNREISSLKEKIPRLISTGQAGDASLASIYIDRVIELEKIKHGYMSNVGPNDKQHKTRRKNQDEYNRE